MISGSNFRSKEDDDAQEKEEYDEGIATKSPKTWQVDLCSGDFEEFNHNNDESLRNGTNGGYTIIFQLPRTPTQPRSQMQQKTQLLTVQF